MNLRLISGFFMGLILLSSIFFLSNEMIEFLVILLILASFREFLHLRFKETYIVIIYCLILFLILGLSSIAYHLLNQLFLVNLIYSFFLIAGIAWWVCASILIFIHPLGNRFIDSNLIWILIGLIIHTAFWASIVVVLNSQLGEIDLGLFSIDQARMALLLISFISISMDTLAYLFGRKFGLRKLAPNISPNKSVEGLMGALFVTLFLLFLINISLGYDSSAGFFLVISLICIFSVIGDITESMFKRIAGVKDSSNLIPGHGGVLDRIDSHLSTFPVCVTLSYLLFF
jgi:phosphatidate cytidylyltransferase